MPEYYNAPYPEATNSIYRTATQYIPEYNNMSAPLFDESDRQMGSFGRPGFGRPGFGRPGFGRPGFGWGPRWGFGGFGGFGAPFLLGATTGALLSRPIYYPPYPYFF